MNTALKVSGMFRKLANVLIDSLLVLVAFYLACIIGASVPEPYFSPSTLLPVACGVLIVRLSAFAVCGLYRWPWRYASTNEMLKIVYSATAGSLVIALAAYTYSLEHPISPGRAIFAEWVLIVLLMWANRFSVRIIRGLESQLRAGAKRVIIIGAGDAGESMARQILYGRDDRYLPVGFLDDDPSKLGRKIHNLKVLGKTDDAGRICAEHNIQEILIAIPSAEANVIQSIVKKCIPLGLPCKVLPGTMEIISGDSTLKQFRNIRVQDLLGRETVRIDEDEIRSTVRDRNVLITGAAGSIGSELARQVLMFGPRQVVLYDNSEEHLYYLEIEFARSFPPAKFRCIVGDIRDDKRLSQCFVDPAPHIVFHAAAYKHVPLMEKNEIECVKTNVFGTNNLITQAAAHRVEKFVLVSTDKAVRPTSVMGATKRTAEMLALSQPPACSTKFMIVRFGNVLGSRGSVVPLFMEQIEAGGPVTVTHPDILRYFMTIPEASRLIIQACAMGAGGELFVLDMGEPVRILDLANNLIRLSGLEPQKDIQIEFTGLRPGEKMHEEILTQEEGTTATRNDKIFIARPDPVERETIAAAIRRLQSCMDSNDSRSLRRILMEIVPDYRPAP